MKLTTGMELCGFTVQRVRVIKELDAVLVEMIHEHSGARLCWMDNKETNKLFSVAFKTLPEDSTGVFHILEHSVLSGSTKYPVKEPFVELLKGSMNTFLNAMTYGDKTIYPVSSRNEHDFLNLTSVYLDAVFAPRLLEDPNIFYQEGHHMELEDGKPSYKGVVFNEMKGAMSDVDARLERGMNELLFPDNCYRFNSGGDPRVIPDLSYEQYVETYRRYYHPSNAYFFLDGDIPLQQTLHMIDSYLSSYERKEVHFDIPLQQGAYREATRYYEVGKEESDAPRAMLAMGKVIGTWKERVRLLAAQVLCDYLADSNESPLKRAILSEQLAEDLELVVMDEIAQPYLMLVVRNMEQQNAERIRRLIKETVAEEWKKGLDKEMLMASINQLAFRMRESREPQGLYHATDALCSWLYGGDPLQYLIQDEDIGELRRMADENAFAPLLEELLLQEENMAVLHMLPDAQMGLKLREEEEARLQKELASLSAQERDALIARNEALLKWQETPDTSAQLATLPTLSLNEVSDTPEPMETLAEMKDGATLLYHPVSTHGVVYLSLYFPLTKFSLNELTALSLLPSFFGELPSEHYDAAALRQKIKTYIGRLHFHLEVQAEDDDPAHATPYLSVHASVLEEHLSKAEELLSEILLHTRFDETKRMQEIVMQTKEEMRMMAISSGHSFGLACVQAHYSAQAAVQEACCAYTFMTWLNHFAKHFDEEKDAFRSLIDKALHQVIGKTGAVFSVTAAKPTSLSTLRSLLPQGYASPKHAAYQTALPKRLGIQIPAQIAFAVKGYHLSRCDEKAHGSLRVAAKLISYGYLWNMIRVQGGAYGTGMPIGRDGSLAFYSFRDPRPDRSLQVFDHTAAFVREFCDSEEALEKYIISSVASSDPLRTPREKGLTADAFWFAKISEEDRIQLRREMLACDREMLLHWRNALNRMAEDGAVCVIGHDAALRECKDLTIYEL